MFLFDAGITEPVCYEKYTTVKWSQWKWCGDGKHASMGTLISPKAAVCFNEMQRQNTWKGSFSISYEDTQFYTQSSPPYTVVISSREKLNNEKLRYFRKKSELKQNRAEDTVYSTVVERNCVLAIKCILILTVPLFIRGKKKKEKRNNAKVKNEHDEFSRDKSSRRIFPGISLWSCFELQRDHDRSTGREKEKGNGQ